LKPLATRLDGRVFDEASGERVSPKKAWGAGDVFGQIKCQKA